MPFEAKTNELSGSATSRKIVYISGASAATEHLCRIDHSEASARRLGHRVVKMSVEDAPAGLTEVDGADLVVIWRCAWNETIDQVIQRARAAKAKIVVDIDDPILEPVSSIGATDTLLSKDLDEASVQSRLALIEKIIICADLCTAATQRLLHQLRHFGKPLLRVRNGFDEQTYTASQLAAEARSRGIRENIRIGCVGCPNDLPTVELALTAVLSKYRNTILVLFGEPPALDQCPALAPFEDRIEPRGDVLLADLPHEFARLDIVIVASGARQRLAEASLEISYLHAALARVPMVVPSSLSSSADVTPGVTGFVAESEEEWSNFVSALVEDGRLRQTIGENALHDVLWRYGPEGRDRRFAIILDYLFSTRQRAAEAYRSYIEEFRKPVFVRPLTPEYDIVFQGERRGVSPVAVIVPLYNYYQYVEEALESVKNQTLDSIDLVVVDDCSTDNSLKVARHWIENNEARFNHVALLRNKTNSTLGPTRNVAFAFTSARYIMTLDADNILLPPCLERCLAAIESSGAAAAFPILKQFGASENLMGSEPWQPARLACSNYIDAMAMIRKAAWAACGGYSRFHSREDYELWMKFVERGFWATQVPEVLALYRVHGGSMVHTYTKEHMNNDRLWDALSKSHPWIAVPTWSRTQD